MATTYQQDQVEAAPPWLRGPYGAAWLAALGLLKDTVAGWSKEAVKARMPALAPSDALGRIGQERGIDRGIVETEAAYRARLQAAFTAWQWGGTAYGLLAALVASGYPTPIIQIQNAKQYTLDANGNLVTSQMATPVHLGGTPAELWSDFAVYIAKPWPSWWAGVAPADGSNDQKTVANLIKRWKPGHARNVKLLVLNAPTWGVSLLWNSFTWGSATNTTWTPVGV